MLVDRYKYLVVGTAMKCFKSYKNLGIVSLQDMIGMGYIGLLEANRKFNNAKHDKFATYAFHRVRGNILDETNSLLGTIKRKRHGITVVNMSDELLEENTAEENSIVNDIYKKELLAYIDYAIDRFLTEREKEAINLRFKKGLNFKESSKEMGISIARVQTLCKNALNKLKKRTDNVRKKISN